MPALFIFISVAKFSTVTPAAEINYFLNYRLSDLGVKIWKTLSC